MDSRDMPTTYTRVFDIVAWVLVAASSLAVTGLAIGALAGAVTVEPYIMAVAAACLVASCGFAVIRQLRNTRAVRDHAAVYDIAFASENAARERLSFARHTAALMAGLPEEEGLRAVLVESLDRFGAEASAIVGGDRSVVTSAGMDDDESRHDILKVAAQTVKAGRAVADEVEGSGANTLTIPLRIRGQLTHVIAMWKRGGAFSPDDLDGLSLVARIIELSMENRELLGEVRDQLSATLRMMIGLVEQRLPEYGAYSQRVVDYAVATGRIMGLADADLEDLRTAGLLHDVGMLTVPEAILTSPRRLGPDELAILKAHPVRGEELTRVANFDAAVQAAIRSHHERVDGSGYPDGLSDGAIPLASRILTVCDAFVALISDRPHRPRVSEDEAVGILRASAGTHYDSAIVEHFVTAKARMAQSVAPAAAPAAQDVTV
jgi:HD-GYP domain-containing protein (c-di-GMP phosphodiesterase class II)